MKNINIQQNNTSNNFNQNQINTLSSQKQNYNQGNNPYNF